MSDTSDVATLAVRIQELEAQLIRTSVIAGRINADTDCTHCNSDCTHCPGDQFLDVLLPGEFERLSGASLVKQLRAK
jgi:hypothetical protein